MNFILASASPRRREMLQHLGLDFCVVCADADESSEEKDGQKLVELLATRKATAVLERLYEQGALTPDTVILAADTVVVSPEGEILGKPRDKDDARRMLRALSGNTHRVISGICVIADGRTVAASEVTEVTFEALSDAIIDAYIASGEPMDKASGRIWNSDKPRYYWEDKAGGYGIQDPFGMIAVKEIRGDYYNVVGLPVSRLYRVLKENNLI